MKESYDKNIYVNLKNYINIFKYKLDTIKNYKKEQRKRKKSQ